MSASTSAPFTCDGCGCVKRNDDIRWRILLRVALIDVPGAAIYDWDDGLATLKHADHSCGDRCTLTLVERYLALEQARKGMSA